MFKKYYLAYGSNLNLMYMHNRCKSATLVGTYIIRDYRLIYKGYDENKAYLTIEKCPGAFVPVGIYSISIIDEFKLDRYEGYPKTYYKEDFVIEIAGKKVNAFIYIMNEELDYNIPNKSYIDICKRGYKDFSFDEIILDTAYNNTIKELGEYKLTKNLP